MQYWLIIVTSLLLNACVAIAPGETSYSANSKQTACGNPPSNDTALRLDMVQQLMADGRMHAALAHLDELDSDATQATYLRAEILRQSDRSEQAKRLYQQLTNSCFAGQGHHGLGLIAGRNQQLAEAELQLAKAAELLPVNARIRNDYGYALLITGKFDSARHEFLTAMQLDDANRLAETNMVILLFLQDQPEKARSFANKLNMDSQTLADLQLQAKALAKQISSAQP
ncbi:MAG: hypothetical protein WEB02_05490 [Methylophaga sp.]